MRRRQTTDAVMTETLTEDAQSTSPETGRSRRSRRSPSDQPAKISRLQPSTPLHMTTRRAASRVATDSIAGSIASISSRRSSLASIADAVNGRDDADQETPLARTRSSLRSISSQESQGSKQPSLAAQVDNGVLDDSSQGSSRSLRKRKRHTDEVIVSIEAETKDEKELILDATDSLQYAEEALENDSAPRMPEFSLRRRGRRGRQPRPGNLGSRTSATATPSGSAMPSPLLAPQDFNDVDVVSNDQGLDRPTKRLPGRRRAPHPDNSIEADLRRQLSLKMAYRAVAKLQKLALVELAQRSLDDLENDPESHEHTEQYHMVQEQLDSRLQRRLAVLDHVYRLNKKNIENHLRWDKDVQMQMYESKVRDLQDDYRIRAEHRMLRLLRRLDVRKDQLQKMERPVTPVEIDDEATEDEGDGVFPALKAPPSQWTTGHVLDDKFESRSRFYVLTDQAMDETAERLGFAKHRKAFLEHSTDKQDLLDVDSMSRFATYEPGQYRTQGLLSAVNSAAKKERESELFISDNTARVENGLDVLAGAAEQQEPNSETKIPTDPVTPAQRPRRNTQGKTDLTETPKRTVRDTPASTSRSKRKLVSSTSTGENSLPRTTQSTSIKAERADVPQTPRASGNKISDLLNSDSSTTLPGIAGANSATPSKPFGPILKEESESSRKDNSFLPSIRDITSVHGFLYPISEKNDARPDLGLQTQNQSRETSSKLGPRSAGDPFWSRMTDVSRESINNHRAGYLPSDDPTLDAQNLRRPPPSPSQARPPIEQVSNDHRSPVGGPPPPPAVDISNATKYASYSASSSSAMASPAMNNLQSPAMHHNRGYSFSHIPRASWDSDASRRASAAVPPQYSITERAMGDRPKDIPSNSHHHSNSQPFPSHARASSYDRGVVYAPPHHPYSAPSAPATPTFPSQPLSNSSSGYAYPYQNGYIPGTGSFWPSGAPPHHMPPPPSQAHQQQQAPYGPPPPGPPLSRGEHGYGPYGSTYSTPPYNTPQAPPPLPPPAQYPSSVPPPPTFHHYTGQPPPLAPVQTSMGSHATQQQSQSVLPPPPPPPVTATAPPAYPGPPRDSRDAQTQQKSKQPPPQTQASASNYSRGPTFSVDLKSGEKKRMSGFQVGWNANDPFRQWDGGHLAANNNGNNNGSGNSGAGGNTGSGKGKGKGGK